VAAAHADWAVPALWIFLVSYVVFAVITWSVYVRSRFAREMTGTRTGQLPRAMAGAAA
jgi:hypothetical protein